MNVVRVQGEDIDGARSGVSPSAKCFTDLYLETATGGTTPGQGATEVHFLFTIVAGGSFAASATGSITGRGLGRALSNR